jgi:uncharacterized protein (AIM24 family)
MNKDDLPPALRSSSSESSQSTTQSQQPAAPQMTPAQKAEQKMQEDSLNKPELPSNDVQEKPTAQRPVPTASNSTQAKSNTDSEDQMTGSDKGVDYVIHNNDVQFVEINLKQNAGLVYHRDSIMSYDDGIEFKSEMNTGDQGKKGMFGKMMDAGKAAAKGEQVFITSCYNPAIHSKKICFSGQIAGSLAVVDLNKMSSLIYRDGIFLCASKAVKVGRAMPNESGSGTFSTGLKLGKLEGHGLAFLRFDGGVYKRTLANGEVLNAPVGYIAARQGDVVFKINKKSQNGKTKIYESVTGPGDVWIQSAPFNKIRDRIISQTMAFVREFIKKHDKKKKK